MRRCLCYEAWSTWRAITSVGATGRRSMATAAHQRPGLRRLLPALLFESHAGDEFFPLAECRVLNSECIVGCAVRKAVVRRGGHEPPGEPGQVRLRRLAMAGRGLGWLAAMYSLICNINYQR